MASQIRLMTPAPAIAARFFGATGGNVSNGVTQVRGDGGPITTLPNTLIDRPHFEAALGVERDPLEHVLGANHRRRRDWLR